MFSLALLHVFCVIAQPVYFLCSPLSASPSMNYIRLAWLLILTAPASLAGTLPALIPEPATRQSTWGVSGEAELGYDSAHYFRGLWFSSNNAWGNLSLSIPTTGQVTFDLGAFHTQSLRTSIPGEGNLDFSELDLSAALTYDAKFAEFGLVFTHYTFFNTYSGRIGGQSFGFEEAPDSTVTSARDLGLTLAVPFGDAVLSLGAWHDFKIDAQYFEAGLSHLLRAGERLSIASSANIGYGLGYYSYPEIGNPENGLTAVRLGVSVPYRLSQAFTLAPYLAANLSLATRSDLNTTPGRNHLFGGVALTASF
jgi:hypothetical protein